MAFVYQAPDGTSQVMAPQDVTIVRSGEAPVRYAPDGTSTVVVPPDVIVVRPG